MDFRIGHGFDIHRFCACRKLVLGGVTIDYELGLQGHSDADVIIHALMDSILGACGLPDIGNRFPPSDESYRGCSSLGLLDNVWSEVSSLGWSLVNLDIAVMAEAPKLATHIPAMKECIARVLHTQPDRVGIKATTMEGLGAIGRREGIAASAVALLIKAKPETNIPIA